MKRAIILAAVVLAACQPSESKEAPAPRIADETALKVGSKVTDLRIVSANKLPANPKQRPIEEYCSGYAIVKPKSQGGRLALQDGWIVTSETKLGEYDAINFVGALDASTSATCFHENGNLAIFDGARLRAIAYWQHSSKNPLTTGDNGVEDSLGSADQLDQRRIRLNFGLPSAPFADVVLRDGIFVEPTAKEDPVCEGSAVVPNIYDQEIRTARTKLRAFGWRPLRVSRDGDMWAVEKDLFAKGVTEIESCAGTGYGFCAFNYKHKKGFTMRVITAGEEDHRVTSFDVACGGAPPR